MTPTANGPWTDLQNNHVASCYPTAQSSPAATVEVGGEEAHFHGSWVDGLVGPVHRAVDRMVAGRTIADAEVADRKTAVHTVVVVHIAVVAAAHIAVGHTVVAHTAAGLVLEEAGHRDSLGSQRRDRAL